jgi:uncharacterized membrane protein
MDLPLLAKWLHVISSTVLFGTGIGTAFFFLSAVRTRDPYIIAATGETVVLADWLFTATSGVVQPLTGFYLVYTNGYDLSECWLFWTLAIYAVAFLCWVPVVWLQIKLQKMAARAAEMKADLPPKFMTMYRWWFALGWPAFIGLLIVFYLMIAKPAG